MVTTREAPGKKRKPVEEISFTDANLVGITTPYHDPLVITPTLRRRNGGQARLHRVLVDTDASVDILYWNAFIQLRLRPKPMSRPRVGIQADRGPDGWYSHDPRNTGKRGPDNDSASKVHCCKNKLWIQCHTGKYHLAPFLSSYVILAPMPKVPNDDGSLYGERIVKNSPRMLLVRHV